MRAAPCEEPTKGDYARGGCGGPWADTMEDRMGMSSGPDSRGGTLVAHMWPAAWASPDPTPSKNGHTPKSAAEQTKPTRPGAKSGGDDVDSGDRTTQATGQRLDKVLPGGQGKALPQTNATVALCSRRLTPVKCLLAVGEPTERTLSTGEDRRADSMHSGHGRTWF